MLNFSFKTILFEKKYQTFDTVFHHQMKHLEVRQKYFAARRIFKSLLGVSSGDETLHVMFDILHEFQTGLPFLNLVLCIFTVNLFRPICPSTSSTIDTVD